MCIHTRTTTQTHTLTNIYTHVDTSTYIHMYTQMLMDMVEHLEDTCVKTKVIERGRKIPRQEDTKVSLKRKTR